MIQLRLDDEKALCSLSQIAQNLQQGRKLHGMLGEALRHIHKQRFEKEQASPEGRTHCKKHCKNDRLDCYPSRCGGKR